MTAEPVLSGLLVGEFQIQDRLALRDVFQKRSWRLLEFRDARRALLQMDGEPIQLVITESDSSDGSWKALLEHLQLRGLITPLIVTSRLADDRLWAEVLNLGGFDLLCSHPLDREELERVLASAARHCRLAPSRALRAGNWRCVVA